MSANASAVLTAVTAALATVSGLTGIGKVIVGRPPSGRPASVPSAYVWHDGIRSSRVDTPLGHYRRDMTVRIVLYGQASTAAALARTQAALDLTDLVMAAIETDLTLNGTVYDLEMDAASIDGDDLGLPNLLAGEIELRCYWHVAKATGV